MDFIGKGLRAKSVTDNTQLRQTETVRRTGRYLSGDKMDCKSFSELRAVSGATVSQQHTDLGGEDRCANTDRQRMKGANLHSGHTLNRDNGRGRSIAVNEHRKRLQWLQRQSEVLGKHR